jgi:hypothetical protein
LLFSISIHLGSYCKDFGLTEPNGLCNGGYFCPGGQNTSSPIDKKCTPGHFCPAGCEAEQACVAGTFQDEFAKVIYNFFQNLIKLFFSSKNFKIFFKTYFQINYRQVSDSISFEQPGPGLVLFE